MIVAFSVDVPLLVNWPLVQYKSHYLLRKKKKKKITKIIKWKSVIKKKSLMNVQECPVFFCFVFFCNRGCLAGDGKWTSQFVELRLLLIGSVL